MEKRPNMREHRNTMGPLSQRSKDLEDLNAAFRAYAKSVRSGAQLLKSKTSPLPLVDKIAGYYLERKSRHFLRKTLSFVVIALLLFGGLWFCASTNVAFALSRMYLIKIRPWWDWEYLREAPCVLENFTEQERLVSDEHCGACDDMQEIIERKHGDLNQFQVGEDFLVEDLPLVIRGAVDSHLRMEQVLEHHRKDHTLEPCKFRTNLKTKTAFNFDAVLRKVGRNDLQLPWFAFWELCKHHNVRQARSVVPRPDELPLMLEIGDSVWFFTASNFSALTYKKVLLSTPVFWLSQISGTSRLRLVPRGVCQSVCRELELTLHAGDLLLMTDELFEVGWMPGMDAEVLAIGAGAK